MGVIPVHPERTRDPCHGYGVVDIGENSNDRNGRVAVHDDNIILA